MLEDNLMLPSNGKLYSKVISWVQRSLWENGEPLERLMEEVSTHPLLSLSLSPSFPLFLSVSLYHVLMAFDAAVVTPTPMCQSAVPLCLCFCLKAKHMMHGRYTHTLHLRSATGVSLSLCLLTEFACTCGAIPTMSDSVCVCVFCFTLHSRGLYTHWCR